MSRAEPVKGRICARCGAALKHYAMGRLCPNCMLQGGLHEAGRGVATDAEPVARGSGPVAWLPQAFGDYELIEIIARGGMGVVYKARQKSLNRIVAVKMLLSGQFAEPKFVQRFRAEAEAVAQLQHPNIVAIHEIGECDGQPFFSMDYVEGKSLAQMNAELGSRGLEFQRSANWVKTIAEAVQYAHERGIIHRDLKPSNVLIDSFDRPRITDFGLMKRLTGDSDLTLTGQVLGSPNYLPPEQADPKRGKVGVASDVYALGAILYHLITGRPPFQAESLTTLLRQVIESDPVAPRSLNPSIPRDLETICLKCLEKDASRRYPTAQALADELRRYLEGKPILARPVRAAGKAWKWCRRQPALAGTGVALLLTLVAGLAAVLWQMQRAKAGELAAKKNAYAADMNLAHAALENGDLRAAETLLDAHRPVGGSKDLRGWEWRHLWQRCRSHELFELTRGTRAIEQIGFPPGGGLLAIREGQTELAFWNFEIRQRAGSLKTRGSLDAFAFSQRGNLLAYVPFGPICVSIMNLETRQEMARLPDSNNVASMAFSVDEARLFIFGIRGGVESLTAWDIPTKRRLWNSTNFPSSLMGQGRHMAFSPDARFLAYQVENGIGLCALESGEHSIIRFSGIDGSLTAIAVSSGSKLLAAGVGVAESEVYVWTVESLLRCDGVMPKPLCRLGKHRDWISALAFSPDERTLVSASADSTLRVWELDQPGPGRLYQGPTHQLLSVAWSPDGKYVVSGGGDGSVRVWDPWKEPVVSNPSVFPAPHWNFCLSADGKSALALNATNRAAVIWDTRKVRQIEKLDFAGTKLERVTWSPDGRLLAAVEAGGNVTIWDLVRRRAVTNLSMGEYKIMFPEFSSDGKFLIFGAQHFKRPRQRRLGVWQVDGWREIQLPVHSGTWGAFSPHSRNLIVFRQGGALELWDIPSGRLWKRLSQPFASGDREVFVAYSPDGRTFASSSTTGVVCLWDAEGENAPVILPSTSQELWSLAFTPDGTRLLMSGKRASDVVRLFDLSTKRLVGSLSGKPDEYWYVRMSADNSTVVAASRTTALVWRAPSWAEIEAAENQAHVGFADVK